MDGDCQNDGACQQYRIDYRRNPFSPLALQKIRVKDHPQAADKKQDEGDDHASDVNIFCYH